MGLSSLHEWHDKRADTSPELVLRRALFAAGLRYRLHHPVPGLPRRLIDIALPRARVAVFVDGCFWHACPVHATPPKANGEWWAAKLRRNRERDEETTAHLKAGGWQVVRVWEQDPLSAVPLIVAAVRGSPSDGSPSSQPR